MTRGLTVPCATQAVQRSGAFPVHVLEVQWASGARFYGDGVITTPVPMDPRVVEWGSLTVESKPEKMGGQGELTLTLADHDLAYKALADAEPGLSGTPAYVSLWFVGTDWADRLTLFGGTVARPSSWDDKKASWKLKLQGFEKKFSNQELGTVVTRERFQDIDCEACEGKIIPIVFGDPCKRVPCCVINRPGKSWLGVKVGIHDVYLYLCEDADKSGFTVDAEITIVVGVPGNTEEIIGGFYDAGNRRKFTIASRGYIEASGLSPGLYTSAGSKFFLVDEADVPDPTRSRKGYPIYIFLDGSWHAYLVNTWTDVGSSIATANVTALASVPTGTPWKLSKFPMGYIPSWPVGCEVSEKGPWTYAVNYLPSKEVIRIEAMSSVQPPGGGDAQEQWYTYGDTHYTVNLDDRAWNGSLGRQSTDPGITTATIESSPTALGLSGEQVYCTLKGIVVNDDIAANDPIVNPALIIRTLLFHRWLGNVGAGKLNTALFDAAQQAVHDAVIDFAFGLTEHRKLLEVCSDLAFQAGCLYWWDQGQACLKRLKLALVDVDKSLTVNPDNIKLGTLTIDDPAENDRSTEISGEFKETCAVKEVRRIIRSSEDQVAVYGRQRKDIKLWAIQSNVMAAKMTEFWLEMFLLDQRQVTFTTYLPALHLQPGDIVRLDYANGSGASVLNGTLARVQKLTHQFLDCASKKMEQIAVTAVTKLWDVDVQVAPLNKDECNPPTGDANPHNPGDDGLKPPPDHPEPTTTTTSTTTTAAPTTTSSTTTAGPGTTTTSTTTTAGPTTTSTTTTASPCGYNTTKCIQINFPRALCGGTQVQAATSRVLAYGSACQWTSTTGGSFTIVASGGGGNIQAGFAGVGGACSALGGNIYGRWTSTDRVTWTFVSSSPSSVTWDGVPVVTEITCP